MRRHTPIVEELRDELDAGAPVVGRPKRQVEAVPAARTRTGTRALGYFAASDKRVRWSLVAVSVIAILALGLYWLPPTTGRSPLSALQLNAVMTEGGNPLLDGVRYDVYEAATDAVGNRKLVTREYGGSVQFPLPAGRYYVTAIYGSASASTEVGVTAAEITRQTLNLRAGVLSLTSVLAAGGKPLPDGVRYEVYEAATDAVGNRKLVTREYGGSVQFPLPAGRYYVTASSDVGKGVSEVTISPGEVRKVKLRLSRQNDRT
jgi:hypothetical protein